ncbi:MAG: betaine/proline/choline family ABC transporter ATP-binding protein [Desulfuromonadaceae bacterium]|nr:betaine/proline/choline family ABC transporter ATP-binding protein [Desulfuromonadaceae bacterium]
MAKIKVEELFKVFGKNPKASIALIKKGWSKEDLLKKKKLSVGVKEVSFEVSEGEIIVIMGLSGSGKSTIIRCLNRLIEPTAGKIFIDGVDVTALSDSELRKLRMSSFGMVFQKFGLFPHRTVVQNAEYGLEVQGIDKADRRAKALETLELVGLQGWENSYPEQLSGGMQQRVGLARALAVDPDILLMDEAFSALDPLIRREMQDELLALQSRLNKTIVFITHDLDEALKLGDKIIILKDGEIVQQGSPEEILTRPANEYVARFIEDVDVSKVLTAQSVMVKAAAVIYPKDGPKTALRKMKELGITSMMVVNKDHQLRGMVTLEDAYRLANEQGKSLDPILKEVPTVEPDTGINDLFGREDFPLAVIGDDKRLRGLIVRGALLAALADRPSP